MRAAIFLLMLCSLAVTVYCDYCLRDACLKSVERAPWGKRDCSFYLHTTVTPHEVTKTATVHPTKTVSTTLETTISKTATVIDTVVIDVTTHVTKTAVVDSTAEVTAIAIIDITTDVTVVATITDTIPVEIDVTSTETTMVETSTSTVVATIISTVTDIVPARKRGITPSESIRHPEVTGIVARNAPTKDLPPYAKDCGSKSCYTSACSCIGVTASIKTASACTKTITVTVPTTVVAATSVKKLTSLIIATSVKTDIITVTSTSIITDTNVVYDSVTDTVTSEITNVVSVTQTSLETSSYTTVISVAATTTVDVTIPATTTVDATVTIAECAANPTPTFNLQASGGSYNGQYAQLVNSGDLAGDFAIVFGTSTSASIFTIDTQGRLIVGSEYANTHSGVGSLPFHFDTQAQVFSNGVLYVTCSLAPPNILQCTALGGSNQFATCGGFNYDGAGVALTDANPSDCSVFNFIAICLN